MLSILVHTSQCSFRFVSTNFCNTLVKSIMFLFHVQAVVIAKSIPASWEVETYQLLYLMYQSCSLDYDITIFFSIGTLGLGTVLLVSKIRTLNPQGYVSKTWKYLLFRCVESYVPVRQNLAFKSCLVNTATFQKPLKESLVQFLIQSAISYRLGLNKEPALQMIKRRFTLSFSEKFAEDYQVAEIGLLILCIPISKRANKAIPTVIVVFI